MSKSICFYFQVHQPYRLRTYRFFEIGKKHYYYDDYSNRMIMRRVAEKCYLPMNELLMRQIEQDCELACDEAVMKHETADAANIYCNSILHTAMRRSAAYSGTMLATGLSG